MSSNWAWFCTTDLIFIGLCLLALAVCEIIDMVERFAEVDRDIEAETVEVEVKMDADEISKELYESATEIAKEERL